MRADVVAVDIVVPASDRYLIGVQLWHSNSDLVPHTVALINAGAGIAQPYYRRFAEFLARSGIPTILYDYRGIGRSRPASLVGFIASVEQWGALDCTALLHLLALRYPGSRRLVIGHSVGAFVTGFATNGALIDSMLLVSAHTGYWGDYARRARPWMYALWHVLMPAVTSVTGYFPARALHLGEDLPAGVAKEWADRRRGDFWWNLRRPDGEIDLARRDALLARFHQVRARTLALRFTDDAFATEAATTRILALYANTDASTLVLGPSDAGGQKIGHFGFFRARMQHTLWPRVLEWLTTDEETTHRDIVAETPAADGTSRA